MFFFSSRRRHTRLQGDWSSDVCSSDLMKQFDHSGMWLGIGLGVLMLANGFLTHRQMLREGPRDTATGATLRPGPSYFVVLAMVIWLVTTWNNTDRQAFPICLATEAVLLTF